MLPSKRQLFDIPQDVSFFNAAAWSPLPLSTVAEGKRGVETKSRPWDFPTGLDERTFEEARRGNDVATVRSTNPSFSWHRLPWHRLRRAAR